MIGDLLYVVSTSTRMPKLGKVSRARMSPYIYLFVLSSMIQYMVIIWGPVVESIIGLT